MLRIRLGRLGKKKHVTYRIIVSEKAKDTHGDFLEQVGTYDPHTSPATAVLNAERISYWLSKGAQPSGVVHNVLVDKGIIKAEKISVANIKKSKEEPTVAEAPKPVEVKPEEKKETPPVESKPEEKKAPEILPEKTEPKTEEKTS
ncbi:MAG: 30S ribosomal protein S16 [Parcubacteria group bacterium]